MPFCYLPDFENIIYIPTAPVTSPIKPKGRSDRLCSSVRLTSVPARLSSMPNSISAIPLMSFLFRFSPY